MRELVVWVTAFIITLVASFTAGYVLVAFIGLYLPTLDVTQWNGFQRAGFLFLLFWCGVIATSYVEVWYANTRKGEDD